MIGKIIGNYRIEQNLGEGGMGAVYKGIDTMIDREVAIKALRPELASKTAIVERFRSEAVTLAKLNHPNIATLYTLLRQDDELYMVLEYVRGETLDAILQRRGALNADEVIPVFTQILDGINHAHELGIVHRDIKPANIMLTEKGQLKVLDFGIARLLGSARMTRAGNIIGTLEYMAPEQVKGLETDARSDIYSLGMMLYEVLTGQAPFTTENEFELMRQQIEQMPTPPRVMNPAIPEEVEAAILRAIQKNPNYRFQTAGEFREALINAGFAAHGAMRQPTAPHQAEVLQANPVRPGSANRNAAPPTAFTGMPADTRREQAGSTSPFDPETRESSAAPSFFSRLSLIHYLGAGFTTLLLGMLIIIRLFFFGGDNGNGNLKIAQTNIPPKPSQTPTPVKIDKTAVNVAASNINPASNSIPENSGRANTNTMASNLGIPVTTETLINDPQVLKAIKKLIEARSKASRSGDTVALSSVLDETYLEGISDELKKTKWGFTSTLSPKKSFATIEFSDFELEANDGLTAKVSCSEEFYHNGMFIFAQGNEYTAVKRNGTWLLTSAYNSVAMEDEEFEKDIRK